MVKVLFCCFSLHSFQFVIQNKMKEKKTHKISTTTTKNPKAIDHLDVVSWSQCKMSVRNYIHIHTVRCVYVLFHSVWCTFFVSTLYFIQFFFVWAHSQKRNAKWNYFESDQPNDNNNIFFFVHYSGVVIGRIQGRCECTYIRTPANNTLTENQNEQIATAKKDKRKRKINVRKMKKKTKTSNKKTASFFVESF